MTTRFPSTSNENFENKTDSVAVNMPPGQFLNDYIYKPHKQKLLKQMNFEKLISDLQPYFDVEPTMVINRLKTSFYPTNSMQLIRQICMNSIEFEHQVTAIPKDLYGPLMLVLVQLLHTLPVSNSGRSNRKQSVIRKIILLTKVRVTSNK